MAKDIVGYVTEQTGNGTIQRDGVKFISEVGTAVFEDDIIQAVGDYDSIIVTLNNDVIINVNDGVQLLDATVIATEQVDVTEYSISQETLEEALTLMEDSEEDSEDETAAGEEVKEDGLGEALFAERTGLETDINAQLIDANFNLGSPEVLRDIEYALQDNFNFNIGDQNGNISTISFFNTGLFTDESSDNSNILFNDEGLINESEEQNIGTPEETPATPTEQKPEIVVPETDEDETDTDEDEEEVQSDVSNIPDDETNDDEDESSNETDGDSEDEQDVDEDSDDDEDGEILDGEDTLDNEPKVDFTNLDNLASDKSNGKANSDNNSPKLDEVIETDTGTDDIDFSGIPEDKSDNANKDKNNGFGNGDQDAPGNSLENNNAENAQSDKGKPEKGSYSSDSDCDSGLDVQPIIYDF